ncbi:protein kinase domain-containing protein [Sarocladium implicatum]|nr:protein kinase domain-containing protein [Sarocladium implicatum]
MADVNQSSQGNDASKPSPLPTPTPQSLATTPSVPLMSSPAPMLRPALGGGRGGRTPRLGLAIPPSPNAKPVTPQPNQAAPSRPPLPTLHLATPMGSQITPHEQLPRSQGGAQPGQSAGGGSESSAAHSRSGSFGPLDGRASNPTSAGSQFSAISFAEQYGIGSGARAQGTPDPISAVGSMYSERSEGGVSMERDGSLQGLEAFDKLSLEKARNADVEELDDEGWRIASMEKRIQELGNLGEGAGGAVTRCKLKGGNTVITTNPDPDVKKQIVRELGFNKDCASDHICRYYGAFVDPSTATISIAMEFCEGGSLDSIYKEVKRLGGRTGEKVLGKIAEGVLSGLTYLHTRRIIHRDIKPSNILLCRDGSVKLCDFGVSGDFGTKGEANTFIGTSYYMAPERITGQSYTITSDVWSTGVTLLEVAQHRFPFPADGTEMQPRAGLIDLLTYIVRQPVPVLKDEPDMDVYWSDNFKYFIECCLEKQPNRRASPWKMMEHPWMVEMRSKRVNMVKYLSYVWGWDEQGPAPEAAT